MPRGEPRGVDPDSASRVLVVDDEPRNLLAVEAVLQPLGVVITMVRSGQEALLQLLEHDFAVVILDVHMPDMDGFEMAKLVRAAERTRHLPILFLTANHDLARAELAYAHGAVDYLFKPFQAEVLRAKVSVFVDLDRQRRRVLELERRQHERALEAERASFEGELMRTRLEHERQTSEALTAVNAQLEVALAEAQNALAARESFLRMASHELKTPLTSMQLTLARMDRHWDQGHEPPAEIVQRSMEIVRRQTTRLARLSDELLSVVLIEAGRLRLGPERAEVMTLIHGALDEVGEILTNAGCVVDLEVSEALSVRADPFWLQRSIANLLTNAAKFGAGRPIQVRAFADKERVRLSVRDRGPGVPLAQRARIFAPFERGVGSENLGGFGLGLYVVKQVLEAHGGKVGVDGDEGTGAVFWLELPAA